jgi:RNA polymerase sigma factor (sigma-70 family)
MNIQYHNRFLNVQPKLYRFAVSLTGDINDAEDIYQETLLKIWLLKEKWQTWENFEAYAIRMMRNIFLNYRKSNAIRAHSDLADVKDFPDTIETDHLIIVNDLRMRFIYLIGSLPQIQRDILYLREIEEMDYKEIAFALDITESQVKVYLFRGRQNLKRKTDGKK